MPKHPVPKGYGSPCNEGEIVTQGTGSGPVYPKYPGSGGVDELDQDSLRNGFTIDNDNLFDC